MFSTESCARLLLAVATAGFLLCLIGASPHAWHGKWLIFDKHDLDVYFKSSRWIIEGGHLYREVWSEYQLLANVVFATWRYLGNLIYPGMTGFQYTWVITAGLVF